jgi:hypothetical protein
MFQPLPFNSVEAPRVAGLALFKKSEKRGKLILVKKNENNNGVQLLFGSPYFRETFGSSISAVSTPLIARVGAFSAFFEIYKICILLHRCKLKILTQIR